MPITIQRNIEIEMTPENLAQIFTDMTDVEQCRYFNHIGKVIQSCKNPIELQLDAITSCKQLNDDGNRVLNTMSKMFATYDTDKLVDACRIVVDRYQTDGMQGMRERDHLFFKTCQSAIKKIR